MKILIIGSFGKGALENNYVRGFKAIGIEPEKFEITESYYKRISRGIVNKVYNKINPAFYFTQINKELGIFISQRKYDVILVFKGLTLFPETIKLLKTYTTIIACYNPDHPYEFYSEGSGNRNILDSIRLYDLYFTYSKNIAKGLSQKFNVASFVIPFGFEPNPIPRSEGEYANHWLMLGSYDKARADFLVSLNLDSIQVYGEQKWSTRNKGNLIDTKYFQGKALFENEYFVACKEANGVFNYLREQNIAEGSHNMRTFEVPGAGGLLISQRTEEQSDFFEEDAEAIYFDTITELKERLQYLERNHQKISAMKSAALKRAMSSGYTYHHRSKQMAAILKSSLS
ncbi:MAG: glycosyltransferase family 1 protein [Sphingobacteriales bacterium]|nr:MAG: glycosyltransferase family 1 protein [Sphingobacteriales bacterium]